MYSIDTQLLKLKRRLNIVGNKKDDLLLDLLDDARIAINNRRRFHATDEIPLEEKYYSIQITLAVCAYNKIGGEGELTHNENGTNRGYESGDVYPNSVMSKIIPLVI